MISAPTPFWIDARHAMHDLAQQAGAAAIVGVPAGYVVISAETMDDVESMTDREILDSEVMQ